MAKIKINNIKKTFGKVVALDDVTLEVQDKEFFVLFGPAGAGKTTILNTIAGLVMPEEGTVEINDEMVNLVETADRDVAMVFENYALYPHMSVYDNIASPLRSPRHKQDEDTIKEAVQKVTQTLRIDKLQERLPSQLSNGQKQRVALGRALVRDPNVFLMDEPLAHLDAKLKSSMRSELKEMQASFDTTTIYVTHDFSEAMSLGDRIAIINNGKIVQVGTGDEVYYMPKSVFVAQLMGDPEMNIFPSSITKVKDKFFADLVDIGIAIPITCDNNLEQKLVEWNKVKALVGVRPSHIAYFFEEQKDCLRGKVYSYESLGNKSVMLVQIQDCQIRVTIPNELRPKLDSDVYLRFNMEHAIIFDHETQQYIGRCGEDKILAISQKQQKEGK